MRENPSACVLDASALLALLHAEPGADTVERAVDGATVSTVNWSEVHERAAARAVDVAGLRADLEALGLEIVPFTVDDAERAAALRPATRPLGLSLGDRACLALALRLDRPALTADRSWIDLEIGASITSIR